MYYDNLNLIKFVEDTLVEIQRKLEDLRAKKTEIEQLSQLTQQIDAKRTELEQLNSKIQELNNETSRLTEEIKTKQG